MARLTVVVELNAVDGGAAAETRSVEAAGVMAEAGIYVVVLALLDHVDLAGVVLLGGGSEEFDTCLDLALL